MYLRMLPFSKVDGSFWCLKEHTALLKAENVTCVLLMAFDPRLQSRGHVKVTRREEIKDKAATVRGMGPLVTVACAILDISLRSP